MPTTTWENSRWESRVGSGELLKLPDLSQIFEEMIFVKIENISPLELLFMGELPGKVTMRWSQCKFLRWKVVSLQPYLSMSGRDNYMTRPCGVQFPHGWIKKGKSVISWLSYMQHRCNARLRLQAPSFLVRPCDIPQGRVRARIFWYTSRVHECSRHSIYLGGVLGQGEWK